MKLKLLALSLSLFSTIVYAQPNQDMQKMMEQMQRIQTCMSGIDQSEFQMLEQQARQFESELKALCNAGKKTTTLTKALAFSKEISSNKTVQQTRKCTEGLESMIAGMPHPIPNYDAADYEKRNDNICDGM